MSGIVYPFGDKILIGKFRERIKVLRKDEFKFIPSTFIK
jgi:hypothetical protein